MDNELRGKPSQISLKPSEESVPKRRGPQTIANAAKRSRGAMLFDNMESW